MEATYKFTEEQDGKLLHVSCPHNSKYCYDLFSCSFCEYQDNLIIEVEDMQEELELPLFTKSQIEEASNYLWRYAMDHPEYLEEENQHEPNWEAYEAAEILHYYINGQPIELVDIQEAMELYTALQIIPDYRETAEDTSTVKYTAEGLYDYGYNPIDEELPF